MITTIKMDIRRLSLNRTINTLVFSLFTFNINVSAQKRYPLESLPELMDSRLRQVKIDSFSSNSFLVIATNRSCEKCFSDACQLRAKGLIYLIVFEDIRLSAIPATARHYREIVPCVTDVLFVKNMNLLLMDSAKNSLLTIIKSNPTPQMLLKENGLIEHLSYKEFSQFLINYGKSVY